MKKILLSLMLAVVLVFIAGAQTPDPSTLPLVQLTDLSYVGGFRAPKTELAGAYFSYGGKPIAFNPATRSLFVGNISNRIAEITIPATLVKSADPLALPVSTFTQQAFIDPTEGHMGELSTSSVLLGGMLVRANRLAVSASVYYDANNMARLSHFSRSASLTTAGFSGWSSVWRSDRSGFVGGYMSEVPTEWQSRLGGTAITGQCCLSVISRTSYGPSAFAFDPDQIGQASVSAIPLLYYDSLHTTLGPWEGSNPTYGAATSVVGVVIVPGTRSALFFGRNGIGPHCYGNGTADQSLAGTRGPDGELWCYDPTATAKGSHAYPYRYQVWAYDLNDFAAVKAGTKEPWSVLPYGVWPLELPTPSNDILGGATFDAQTRTIYVSQVAANPVEGVLPVMHAISVKGVIATPVPTPTPVDPEKAALEARITDIKALIQQALTVAPKNTATRVITPLKEALKK